MNESSAQSPNSSTRIERSHQKGKYMSDKLPLQRTVTQEAEELGIIIPKVNRTPLKHHKSDKDSDNSVNSDKLIPNTAKNKAVRSITYGNNTIREESSDSEEKNTQKYIENRKEFFKQERLFKRRISQKQRRGSFNINNDLDNQKFDRVKQIRKKRRDQIKNKEFVIELDSQGFFGNSENDKNTENKTHEKLIEDDNIQIIQPNQQSFDNYEENLDDFEESMNENVDF